MFLILVAESRPERCAGGGSSWKEGRLDVGVRSTRDLLLLLMLRASSEEEEAVPGFETETGGTDVGERRPPEVGLEDGLEVGLEVGLRVEIGFRAATEAVLREDEERIAAFVADVTAAAGCC